MPNQSWESQLEELERIDGNKLPAWALLFISQLLKDAREQTAISAKESLSIRQQERERIIKIVDGMMKDDPGADGAYDGAAMYGYNQALEELKSNLQKNI